MDRKLKIKAWLAGGLMLLASSSALAAGMGRLTVLSALGQPFSAEIDLLAVDKKDLGSIHASFASLEAFRDAKIERAPVLSLLRFSVEQRKNGDPYLKIVSVKPIDEPFLDMLVQFDWPSGRLVREYTVLLDPPGYSEKQTAVAPVVPPVIRPVVQPEKMPAAAKPADMPMGAASPEIRAKTPSDKKPPKDEAGVAEAKPVPETYGPVKKGESLSVIAASLKSDSVSLDQALVAMFESNKQAFTGSNMNRLKVGQILKVPAAEQIEEVKASDAAKQVKAHSADWNAYRQKLAAAVEAKPAQEETAKPAASGKITTAVEDKAAAKEPSKDVLRLSRNEGASGVKPTAGSGKDMQAMKSQIQAMQEEATAREKAIKDASQRIADLEKNIKEMQRLLELRSHGLADLQKQAAAPKAEPTPAPVEKPAVEPKKIKPVPVQPKQPELSPLDELMAGNPLYLGGGAAALLFLGLLGARAVAARRRKTAASFVDSVMTQGDLKADTVLGGASGGRVDTSDTSFLTDFSQAGLGSIDSNEVDPLAEAEVYMAYGRDAQAEEILREALVKDPGRHEIRLKLLEIYAGRKSLNDFGAVAGEIYAALSGQASPIWDKVAEMGRALDPQNPLYGNEPKAAESVDNGDIFDKTMVAANVAALVGEIEPEPVSAQSSPEAVSESLDFNLDAVAPTEESQPAEEVAADLGFNLDFGAMAGAGEQAESPAEAALPEAEEPAADAGLDFNLDMEAHATAEESPAEESGPEAASIEEEPVADKGLDFNLDLETPTAAEEPPAEASGSEVTSIADESLENVMEFDFNTLLQNDSVAPVIEEIPVIEEAPVVEEKLIIEDAPVIEEASVPVIEEAPASEEGLISADSWRDEVMSLDLEAVAPVAPTEVPHSEGEMVEVGSTEEASVLDLPDFLANEDGAPASNKEESIELATPPAEESLLEYDFDLGHEETAAIEEVKGAAVPDLDFSSISLEMDRPAADKADDLPDNFGSEEVSTKLDLARAYMDMGDKEGARDILQEVLKEGAAKQQEEARKLLAELD